MIAAAVAIAIVVFASHDDATPSVATPQPVMTAESIASPMAATATTTTAAMGALRLEGLVVDRDDHPIGGATVRLADRTASSEADGSFGFDQLAAGSYAMTAELDELYGEVNDAKLDATSEPVEITVSGGPTLVLHVHDVHGAPIATARAWTSARVAFTDRDGLATLRSVDEGLEIIRVSAPGYAEAELRIEAAGRVAVDRSVTLVTGAAMSGIVLGPDDKPVADARVEVSDGGSGSTDTAADGRWQLEGVPAGAHAVVAGSARFLAGDDLVVTTDGVRPTRDVIVRVRPGGEITGIVVDAKGAPVEGAGVTGGSSATTDEHGRFTIIGLDAGTFVVEASTKTGATHPVVVVLARGGHADVRLVMIQCSLAGVLRNSRGEPIEGAFVAASAVGSMNTILEPTDDRGHFDFGGVLPGDYEISVKRHRHKHELAVVKTVTADNRNVVIVLPDAVRVTGRIVAAGRPVTSAGFVVTPSPEDDRSTPATVDAKTARFEVTDLEAGSYGVIAMAPGFAPKRVPAVPVSAGGALDFGDIALEAGRSIRGRVVDDTGHPIAGARVAIYARNPTAEGLVALAAGTLATTTTTSGEFALSGIAAPGDDPLRIIATHRSAGVSTDRLLGAGESVVELVLAESGSIAGAIDNMAPKQSSVIATSLADSALRFDTEVDAGGAFRFEGLHPGDYRLTVFGQNALSPQQVSVGSGQTTVVRFNMPREPITLLVRSPHGHLVFLHAGGYLISREGFADGAAQLRYLEAGTYSLCVDETCRTIVVAPQPLEQTIDMR